MRLSNCNQVDEAVEADLFFLYEWLNLLGCFTGVTVDGMASS